MDFALEHVKEDGVAVKARIDIVPIVADDNSLDNKLLHAANQAARDMYGEQDDSKIKSSLYQERILPTKSVVETGALIVIFESFDNLNFVYAKPGETFKNRNGHFPHEDFIGKPFGSIVRSRNNRGYGFVYLLKPTPELWARSLTHRTQIVHELDASMICHYLELRPNMVVCESGTGSGAMSHAILRSIAPRGKLHTYEFNESRVLKAREEFKKNGVSHIVDVSHRDVCGKDDKGGGFFGVGGGQRAHAVMLDLPEPWLAVPHAAHVLKPGGRIASYSPCVEQVQRCIAVMKERGFHSIRTLEFRLREHYVDEVKLWSPPKDKRPRLELNYMHHLTYVKPDGKEKTVKEKEPDTKSGAELEQLVGTQSAENDSNKRKSMVCCRPFNSMRGHSAFLTFATAGNKLQPDPTLNGEKEIAEKL